MAVSPYQLLVACKVRQDDPVWAPYDLYSAALSSQADASNQGTDIPVPPPSVEPLPASPRLPQPRTHYIADIKKRHTAAQTGCSCRMR